MRNPTALFLGASGYIGGSILQAFINAHPEINYVAVIRNPKDNAALERLGVRVLQGSNADSALVEKAASEASIVVNCADADDLGLANAIIKGLLIRAETQGDGERKPIYIHTSGTGVVVGPPTGAFQDGKVYDDYKEEDIRSIDSAQPHRNVDLKIFAAGDSGNIDTYIVAPSTIYGTGIGPVRNISQQVNGLIKLSAKLRQVVLVGPGTNVWNNVHIQDLAALYILVLESALAQPASQQPRPSAYERFYWGSTTSFVWGELGKELAVRLHRRGLVDNDGVKSVSLEEYPNLMFLANNSRTVANRGFKQLGWKPIQKSLVDTLEEEIDLTLSKD